jgi:CBS domain containing-hemolysin-like protein
MVLATLFSMIFGELVPNSSASQRRWRTAKVVAAPVRWFTSMKPLIAVLNGSANALPARLGIEPQEELSAARSPPSWPRWSAPPPRRAPSTPAPPARHRIARFGDQTAADVMTPRSRATAIERTASAAELVALARRPATPASPSSGEDWDDIDGIVHVKKAIAVPYDRRGDVPVSALMVPPVLVPETLPLDPLLVQLRRAAAARRRRRRVRRHVRHRDARGPRRGDRRRGQRRARPLPDHGRAALKDGSWTVPGLWRPDEVRSRVGAAVPDGAAYETVGGWSSWPQLGRVPMVGDEVVVDGWTVRVVDMDGHRVDRLRRHPPPGEDAVRSGRAARTHAGGAVMSGWTTIGSPSLLARQRLLRRRRVRRDGRAAQPARAARRGGEQAGTDRTGRACSTWASCSPCAQLGITVCSVLLGAISEAALHHALTPIFERLGSPVVADVVALGLALGLIVVSCTSSTAR